MILALPRIWADKGLIFESPALPRKTNLTVFEAALAMLRSSLAVNDPNNNLLDSLP